MCEIEDLRRGVGREDTRRPNHNIYPPGEADFESLCGIFRPCVYPRRGFSTSAMTKTFDADGPIDHRRYRRSDGTGCYNSATIHPRRANALDGSIYTPRREAEFFDDKCIGASVQSVPAYTQSSDTVYFVSALFASIFLCVRFGL